MAEIRNYKVTIFGEHYSLMSDEPEAHVVGVAHKVDQLMKEIAAKMPQATTEKIAVFAALQLASQACNSDDALRVQVDRVSSLVQTLMKSV